MKYIAILTVVFFLTACGQPRSNNVQRTDVQNQTPLVPTVAQIDYADLAEPKDAALAKLYNRSCISCHSVDGAGAPLTGHTEEWQRRLSIKGMSGLVESTVNGLATMPAMGMCLDCTDDEFIALINYMMSKE